MLLQNSLARELLSNFRAGMLARGNFFSEIFKGSFLSSHLSVFRARDL